MKETRVRIIMDVRGCKVVEINFLFFNLIRNLSFISNISVTGSSVAGIFSDRRV